MTKAVSNGKSATGIFLDKTNAFGRVSQCTLLIEFKCLYTQLLSAWFSSYLTPRIQATNVNENLSEQRPIIRVCSKINSSTVLLALRQERCEHSYAWFFLLVYSIKVLYTFSPRALGATLKGFTTYLLSLDPWCASLSTKYAVTKSSIHTRIPCF